MIHYPSKLQSHGPNGVPRRTDSLGLNATQQRSASHPIFLKVEEELHDARRVHADGQEDDLRYALNMVINRVSDLSSLLSEAYKTQAELEVQLNVAKSNLQLVIANNEMLEDALKKDSSGQSKDIGWRRTSGRSETRQSLERSQSIDEYASVPADPSPPPSATPPSATPQDNRFFKFRFNSAAPSSTRPPSRAESAGNSPQLGNVHAAGHLTSPSMPSLNTVVARSKEMDDLTAELEKERAARKSLAEQKKALEDELESLSQALFEEANKMVADERKKRAETEDELKELIEEKEALRSALRLVEGENTNLRSSSQLSSPQPDVHPDDAVPLSFSRSHSRSSSQTAIKSRPASLNLTSAFPPLPPSPSPSGSAYDDDEDVEVLPARKSLSLSIRDKSSTLSPNVFSPEEESQPTPRYKTASSDPQGQDDMFMGPSPWADTPSASHPTTPAAHQSTMAYAGIR